jgi:hypothetical protein
VFDRIGTPWVHRAAGHCSFRETSPRAARVRVVLNPFK